MYAMGSKTVAVEVESAVVILDNKKPDRVFLATRVFPSPIMGGVGLTLQFNADPGRGVAYIKEHFKVADHVIQVY